MSNAESRIHNCDKNYNLKKSRKFFNCDGCKMKGLGERYTCNLCGHELHKECRYPKREVSHENFPDCVFIFHDKPFTRLNKKKGKEFSKCCDACGKDICGFNYHIKVRDEGKRDHKGKAGDCKVGDKDLHPCCLKLKKELHIGGTRLDLKTEVSSKCGKCGKKNASGDKRNVSGWSYVSPCKKYNFHVCCMIEMIQEMSMKYGALALEKMDSRELVRYKKNRKGGKTFLKTIKTMVTILLSVLLGDPTTLICNFALELISRGI